MDASRVATSIGRDGAAYRRGMVLGLTMAEIMLLLKRSGFTGFLLDDHVPIMDGDTDWGHRGRAHAIGYMQGLLRMMEHLA